MFKSKETNWSLIYWLNKFLDLIIRQDTDINHHNMSLSDPMSYGYHVNPNSQVTQDVHMIDWHAYLVHTSTLSCPKLVLATKIVDENKVGTKSVTFL